MNNTKGLLDRIAEGPVICAEGYLFELERRGYLSAGAYVPEVVLEHPEVVAQLHRDFIHAGSDVVEAFTYYAHREKLRQLGKEELLEQMNRAALQIAKEVARETRSGEKASAGGERERRGGLESNPLGLPNVDNVASKARKVVRVEAAEPQG